MVNSNLNLKNFYTNIIKRNDQFESFLKIKKTGGWSELLDKICENIILTLDEDMNNDKEKVVKIDLLKKTLTANFESEFLEEAIEFADKCVELYNDFKSKEKEKDENGKNKKANISQICGLILPVSRIKKILKENSSKNRISVDAPIFLTAVIETYIIEILHRALQRTLDENRKSMKEDDIKKVVKDDENLDKLSAFLK